MSTVVIGLLDLEDMQRHYRQAVVCAELGDDMASQGQLDEATAIVRRYLEPMYQRQDAAARLQKKNAKQREQWRGQKARRRQELKALSCDPPVP